MVLEVLKGELTQNEITSKYGVHSTQIHNWKKQVLEALPAIFSDKRQRETQEQADLIEEYLLVDTDDRECLRSELRRLGFTFTETPSFKIGLNGRGPHQILKAIDTPLTTVRIHMPSLEEAYLAIVERPTIEDD